MNFRTRRPHGRLSLPVLPLLALAGLALAPSAQDPAPEGSGDPLVTVPEDVPPGADQPIASMIQAAGGMDVWMASPGLRWQVLETFRAMRNRNTRNWNVYSRVPMLQRFDPAGNGFVLSEFADLQQQGPDYRRDVYTEGAAWAEQGGSYNRLPASLTRSEAMVRREYFLGAMPFSLQVLGAELEYLVTDGGEPKPYVIRVGDLEELDLPNGRRSAIRLTRIYDAGDPRETRVWLAPGLDFLLVRLEIVDDDGRMLRLELTDPTAG